VLLAGLLATFSRSAVLATALATFVYGAMKFRQNRVRAAVLGAKLVAVTLAVCFVWQTLAPGLWWGRVAAGTRLEQRSVSERVSSYADAARVFTAQPFFGSGVQHYVLALAQLKPNQSSYRYQPVHNAFVLLAVELGIVGTTALLYLWRRHLQRAARYLFTAAPAVAVATATLFTAVGFLDHYLWSLHAGLVLVVATVLVVPVAGGQTKAYPLKP
jgi:O-antigen ligase